MIIRCLKTKENKYNRNYKSNILINYNIDNDLYYSGNILYNLEIIYFICFLRS